MATPLSKQTQEKIENLLSEKFDVIDFAFLIRILPKIGKAMKWGGYGAHRVGYESELSVHLRYISTCYMAVQLTEAEAMAKVEEYLNELL